MRVVGLLAGVGSMLDVAREQGDTVLGNIETRAVFHSKPWFATNFGDKPFHRTVEGFADERFFNAHIALGHPPCGSHSVLGESKVSKDLHPDERRRRQRARASRVGLLPEFVHGVRGLMPWSFALDNLPKILRTVAPLKWWEEQLPDYHITHAIISNGTYGTVQIRRRLWIFGVLKKVAKPFEFKPISARPKTAPKTTLEAMHGLSPLPWDDDVALAHVHPPPGDKPIGGFRTGLGRLNHLTEWQDEVAARYLSQPAKHPWVYEVLRSRRQSSKVGWIRIDPDGYSRVLSGFPSTHHPLTGWPLTPRERARLMDWPDSFNLNPLNEPLNTRGDFWTLTKITGRGVPSAFIRYLLPQLRKHLRSR